MRLYYSVTEGYPTPADKNLAVQLLGNRGEYVYLD